MIFVTVGTNEAPFDRLLVAVATVPGGSEVFVQHGASRIRPLGARCVDFLPFDRLVDEIRRAQVVVSHGGVGSVIVALANGKRPVVMPRLRRYGEAVDDHQRAFAQRFAAAGLVTVVETADELRAAIADGDDHSAAEIAEGGALADNLREYLAVCVGPPTAPR